jgi:hypothetical protein
MNRQIQSSRTIDGDDWGGSWGDGRLVPQVTDRWTKETGAGGHVCACS